MTFAKTPARTIITLWLYSQNNMVVEQSRLYIISTIVVFLFILFYHQLMARYLGTTPLANPVTLKGNLSSVSFTAETASLGVIAERSVSHPTLRLFGDGSIGYSYDGENLLLDETSLPPFPLRDTARYGALLVIDSLHRIDKLRAETPEGDISLRGIRIGRLHAATSAGKISLVGVQAAEGEISCPRMSTGTIAVDQSSVSGLLTIRGPQSSVAITESKIGRIEVTTWAEDGKMAQVTGLSINPGNKYRNTTPRR